MLNASDEVLREVLALEQAKRTLSVREKAREDFMAFVKHVYDGFIEGNHHKQVARQFEKLAQNPADRQESGIEDHPDDAYGGACGTVWS